MRNLKPLFNEQAIATRVNEIARDLNRDCSGKTDIVLISILKGSFLFTADLIRKLTFDFDLAFIEISSYGNAKISGEIQLISESHYDLKNKHVFIIEDIIDTGNTVNYIGSILKGKGAKSIEYITLLLKHEKCQTSAAIKYYGFKIPDVFVAGYGMDCRGKNRNLPYIVIIDG